MKYKDLSTHGKLEVQKFLDIFLVDFSDVSGKIEIQEANQNFLTGAIHTFWADGRLRFKSVVKEDSSAPFVCNPLRQIVYLKMGKNVVEIYAHPHLINEWAQI